MKVKLNKIHLKPFVLVVTGINVIAGFCLGVIVTVISIAIPNEQELGGVGPWSILLFPVLNGLLACMTSALLAGAYNVWAQNFGPLVFECESE